MMFRKAAVVLVVAGVAALPLPAHAAVSCSPGVLSIPKGNALYLFFPTTADATFPNYDGNLSPGSSTSPLNQFDVADLAGGIGTSAQLRDRVHEIVTDDYCEFNVRVNKTTTLPAPPEPRWEIVGVGTDSANGGNLFGLAQDVDTNDADPQDYARVWARSFRDSYGGLGDALNGAGSTLERWATAIGETTAHEAAHNYGAAHGNSAPRTGSSEDQQNNHIMATGSTGLTGEIRAGRNRHFSDTEYEILGHNIGLNTQTLNNWDFVNPNNTSANAMRLTILSASPSLSLSWSYTGSHSPWQNPTITNTGATQNFQGTVYNVYSLDFSNPKSWDGPTAGVVDAGAEFHTGASFSGSPSVIVTRVQLLSGVNLLPLAPRLPGYDAGAADLGTGDFAVNFFNTNPNQGALQIRDIRVRFLPRMLDINSMVSDGRLVDVNGIPFDEVGSREGRQVDLGDRSALTIAKLTDKRSVDIQYTDRDCPPGSTGSGSVSPRPSPTPSRITGPGDTNTGEENYCLKGNALSLFPATYTYITATVVEPNVRHFDKVQNRFVTGPLESKLFYQMGGIVPDFNRNGVDDLIDIRSGRGVDRNNNGVIDSTETGVSKPQGTKRGFNWLWLLLVLILLIILLLVLFLVRRRRTP